MNLISHGVLSALLLVSLIAPVRDARAQSTPRPSAIPRDAASFKGHAYKFFDVPLTWKEAQAKCASLGGHLVIIDSAEENQFVADLVAKAASQDAWIGITDEVREGDWRTVAGKLVSYTNWAAGQPNNKGGEEHYALMSNRTFGKPLGWTWCDQPNESKSHQPGYVCEWNTALKAATTSGSPSRSGSSSGTTSAPGQSTSDKRGAAKSYVIVWDFDVTQGQKTQSGELLIAVPPEEPYQNVRWALVGTLSHRVMDVEGARLLAVRPAGRRFQLKVSVEPTLPEIPKPKTSVPVPANALACLKDNAAFALRNPQTARLARELKADNPLQTVQNIRQWLKENMTYRYAPALVAAQARPVGGIDSILKAKRTDCGGYSSLFVCLCRQCGLPARLIWGPFKIAGGGPPPKDSGLPANYSELGDFNHHSWAEVYVTGWGWIPLEPQDAETPLGRVPDQRYYLPLLRLGAEYYRMNSEIDIAAWNVASMDDYPMLEKQGQDEGSRSTPKASRSKPSPKDNAKKVEATSAKKK